jgi:phage baseplate assembly protein W
VAIPADNPLRQPAYVTFPLAVDPDHGLATSGRFDHVSQQIAQVLFTDPGERVFRHEFGAGLSALVFEPASTTLAELATKRLQSSLSDALQGEVDPRSLEITVDTSAGDRLEISVAYSLATISQREVQRFSVQVSNG